jgi:hypothetical protein
MRRVFFQQSLPGRLLTLVIVELGPIEVGCDDSCGQDRYFPRASARTEDDLRNRAL